MVVGGEGWEALSCSPLGPRQLLTVWGPSQRAGRADGAGGRLESCRCGESGPGSAGNMEAIGCWVGEKPVLSPTVVPNPPGGPGALLPTVAAGSPAAPLSCHLSPAWSRGQAGRARRQGGEDGGIRCQEEALGRGAA